MKKRTKELQHARKRLGLSVAQVATAAKVSPGTIRRLERDDLRWSTLDQLRRVARSVHCILCIEFVDR